MAALDADAAYLASLVREWDRPRYYATLFAPEALRADLFALYAFAVEIERIPDLVSDPNLGEIRLQFWRDRLEAVGGDDVEPAPPVLSALATAIRRHSLPAEPLLAMVDARRADLYSDPPPTVADLEGMLGETQSSIFQLGAVIMRSAGPETADAAGHAGVAYGLAQRLARLAHDTARRRSILPAEILNRHGVTASGIFAAREPALVPVLAEMTELARRHLGQARCAARELPRTVQPAFLPLAAVPPLLRRIEPMGVALLQSRAEVSDLEVLLRIAWARLAGLKKV